ncbi:MAG: class E sortase [Propionicimonas sp.]
MSHDDLRPRGAGWFLRGVVGIAGELMITLGAVLALFVAWQLLWTDVVADTEQSTVVSELEEEFRLGPTVVDPTTAPTVPAADLGDAFAIIRIPRFGADYARPLYEGTDRHTLQQGIGHYAETAGPGEVGNFSMAGHRTTYGKPFSRIAELRDGDLVIVETRDSYFVYKVYDHAIVLPTQTEVILPVPGEPGEKPTEALLTMTSCHPQFSSRERYITHARLIDTLSREDGLPADLLNVEG